MVHYRKSSGGRANTNWSEEEDSLLLRLYQSGATTKEMSVLLRRSTQAVLSRISFKGYTEQAERRRKMQRFLSPTRERIPLQEPLLVEPKPKPVAVFEPVIVEPPVVEPVILNSPCVEKAKAEVEDANLKLLIEFVRMAWNEGQVIAIPSLGATFKKGVSL
jgi:hypothetical protein